MTIWYFLPLRFSDTKLGLFFGQKCHFLSYVMIKSQKIPQNFQRNPQKMLKYSKKIQEFPKHSRITKKFPRFWKYPIPYIALGGRKPFRACLSNNQPLKKFLSLAVSWVKVVKKFWLSKSIFYVKNYQNLSNFFSMMNHTA